jgi:hypothetical protein
VVDPLSIGALGAVAITEGIKFLYAQAGKILDRRAERKAGQLASPEPLVIGSQDLLEHPVEAVVEDAAQVDELAGELSKLRRDLGGIADGVETPDDSDPETIRKVYALRAALEAITGQDITFKGEQREAAEVPVVRGRLTAKVIRGIASGVDTDTLEGLIHGELETETVEKEANAAAVRIRRS